MSAGRSRRGAIRMSKHLQAVQLQIFAKIAALDRFQQLAQAVAGGHDPNVQAFSSRVPPSR